MQSETRPQNQPSTPQQSRAARAYLWALDHLPKSRKNQIILASVAMAVVLVPSTALMLLPFYVDLGEEQFAGLGYAGVFLANLASTMTVVVPVPGLTAAGQALILTTATTLDPVAVGLLGGLGMALGEVTAYAAGAIGSEVARGAVIEAKGFGSRMLLRIGRAISRLMDTHGTLTLFTLAAIPNPFFELAGLTAGAVRMNFWRFMIAVTADKCTRGIILAFIGKLGLEVIGVT